MSVPTHGPYCQTLMYPTDCWYCGARIYVLQCTCGSVVLFDYPRPPWQEHDHSGGIGGSGLSGWAAVDVLRANGIPIVPSILDKVFPRSATKKQTLKSISEDIRSVKPRIGVKQSLLAVVRELHTETNRTERLRTLGGLGAKFFNLPKGRFGQVTLVNNGRRPNLSYTCILPQQLGLERSAKNKMVFAQIEGRGIGENAIWLVTDIRVI